MSAVPESIPDVVDVEWLRGARANPESPPDLLVEVPHGADRRAHYDRLRAELRGDLPDDLHCFFHINTDVGAWQLGHRVAEQLVEARSTTGVLLLRSLIPRTFIDCNRPVDPATAGSGSGELAGDTLTPGVPPYVRDPDDLALLVERHARYVESARLAFEHTCGNGGLAFVPHTYGPHSLDIAAVDDRIVDRLREATRPEALRDRPLRAEIDLLTRVGNGPDMAPHGFEAELLAKFGAAGFDIRANDTYDLHPGSLAHDWSHAYPQRVLCLEVRRDLLVQEWRPFEEMHVDPTKVEPVANLLAAVLAVRVSG